MAVVGIVGPGGAGKTTWLKQRFPNCKVIHAIPFTRKWSHVHTPFVEFFIGLERVITSYKSKLLGKKYNVVMDRCFIDGVAYGKYWNVFWIAKLFNKIIFKPKVIYFLMPKSVKAKRMFEQKDYKRLNILYGCALLNNGYTIRNEGEYAFGTVFKCQRQR